jgi:ABC-type methionine transport system permease subunit
MICAMPGVNIVTGLVTLTTSTSFVTQLVWVVPFTSWQVTVTVGFGTAAKPPMVWVWINVRPPLVLERVWTEPQRAPSRAASLSALLM